MLSFLHLSDLHITTDDADSQFDRDLKVREALLNDLGKEGRSDFDAILVTGDVAYHGRAEEFGRAKQWLEEVRTKTNSNPEALFVVPGNHDVNQAIVSKHSSLWDLHEKLRNTKMSHEERMENLQAKLKDKTIDFLAALVEYRAFAQEYGCATNCKELAWLQFLSNDKTLEDGTAIRFHGLNSAMLSDGADVKANLLLGDFQFSQFNSDPRYVNVVLCHHPHGWLMDDNKVNDFFRTQAHIVLCGHEHDVRCFNEGGSLRLYAGAVHPNRREEQPESCYHVLQLSVDNTTRRELRVRVETRVWREKEKSFNKYVQEKGSDYHEERIPLQAWTRPVAVPTAAALDGRDTVSTTVGAKSSTMTPDAFIAARRKLIVHFFRIGTLSRFQAAIDAEVWEEGDDALDGQARWARVFERAEKSSKLGALWEAVAAKDHTLTGQPNPFSSDP